ncbi:MAG: hypothetical protein GXO09_04210 [Crenarchaeota archaeon]|nr:hypothetical protein [Thermoproteota archaeon]
MTSGAEPPKPYTIIFTTTSIDGRIAGPHGERIQLSCPYDKQRLYLLRGRCDAVMVGANTIINDNPTLRRRLNPKTTRYYRVVIDGKLRIKPTARIITEPGPPLIIITAVDPPKQWQQLETPNQVHIHTIPAKPGQVDLKQALKLLKQRYNIQTLLVEGGGILNHNLLKQHLADELRTTITPHIISAGPTITRDPTGKGNTPPLKLTLYAHETCPCKQCIHLIYLTKPNTKPKIPWSLKQLQQ